MSQIDFAALVRRAERDRSIAARAALRRLRHHLSAVLGTLVIKLGDTLAKWQECSHSRQVLATLDDKALHDIGLSHADAWAETRKPFWRA